MAPSTEEGFLSARDGLKLYWQTVLPAAPEAAPAHVALLHGFAEHLGRHAEVTAALAAAGYVVHLFDCRGHGQSGGKRAHVDRFDDYLGDLDVMLQHARSKAGQKPLFLVAHSHGGLITARYLLDKPDAVKGIAFSNPFFRLKLKVSPLKIWAGKLVGRVLPALPMKNELNPELLTRDQAIQQATRADPLYQHTATPRWFTEATATQEDVMRRATEFVTPFLMLSGAADPLTDQDASREFLEAATAKDKSIKRYDGLLHEIFHEPERDLVFKDLIQWLGDRARSASGAPAVRT